MRLSVICATLGPLCEVDSLIQSIIRALQRADSAIGGPAVLDRIPTGWVKL